MAVLPDYVTGTITLANGSTVVSGTGTMFATAAFKAGDTLQIQNLTAVIASVDSNTSLTLTAPWTGTSLTNAPYRARYLPDGARVTAQTTTLIELLGNGVLSNIASVPVEDGKLLVGNAAGQYEPIDKTAIGIQDPNGSLGKLAALTLLANQVLNTNDDGEIIQSNITAFARTILDDASGIQMWTTMGGNLENTVIKFPNDLLIQAIRTGYFTDASGYAQVIWPTAFLNAGYMVWSFAADGGGGGIPSGTIWNASQGTTAANIYCVNRNTGAAWANQSVVLQTFAWGTAP